MAKESPWSNSTRSVHALHPSRVPRERRRSRQLVSTSAISDSRRQIQIEECDNFRGHRCPYGPKKAAAGAASPGSGFSWRLPDHRGPPIWPKWRKSRRDVCFRFIGPAAPPGLRKYCCCRQTIRISSSRDASEDARRIQSAQAGPVGAAEPHCCGSSRGGWSDQSPPAQPILARARARGCSERDDRAQPFRPVRAAPSTKYRWQKRKATASGSVVRTAMAMTTGQSV